MVFQFTLSHRLRNIDNGAFSDIPGGGPPSIAAAL